MSKKKFEQHSTSSLPALYAIANIDAANYPTDFIKNLLDSGVTLMQLRNKKGSTSEFKRAIETALTLASAYPESRIVVNDSVALAKECGAAGVHLGQTDGSVTEARAQLGADALIGLSTHAVHDVVRAEYLPLSYIALGPIFHSSTKSGHAPPVGLDAIAEVRALTPFPLVVIGGITLQNAAKVFDSGATSAAVIADLARADDLKKYVREFSAQRGY